MSAAPYEAVISTPTSSELQDQQRHHSCCSGPLSGHVFGSGPYIGSTLATSWVVTLPVAEILGHGFRSGSISRSDFSSIPISGHNFSSRPISGLWLRSGLMLGHYFSSSGCSACDFD